MDTTIPFFAKIDLIAGTTDKIFKENGILQTIKNGQFRQRQYDYAMKLAKSFDDINNGVHSQINVLKAETGIGKSLGYAVPLALNCIATNTRGIICTYTKNLRHQLINEMELTNKICEKITGQTVTYAIRRSRFDYTSPKKINYFKDHPDYEKVLAWYNTQIELYGICELASWREEEEEDTTYPFNITNPRDLCMNVQEAKEHPIFSNDLENCKNATIVITTSSMLFHWIAVYFKDHIFGDKTNIKSLVIDEGHKLCDVAKMNFNWKLDFTIIRNHVIKYPHIVKCVDETISHIPNGIFKCDENMPFQQRLNWGNLQDKFGELFNLIKNMDNELDDTELEDTIQHLGFFLEVMEETDVPYAVNQTKGRFGGNQKEKTFEYITTHPGSIYSRLWGQESPLSFINITSASILEIDNFMASIGRSKKNNIIRNNFHQTYAEYSPENFGKMKIVLPRYTLNSLNGDQQIIDTACQIIKLVHNVDVRWNCEIDDNHRTLVIIPSYIRINSVISKLKECDIDMNNVLVQKPQQSISELGNAFKQNKNAILFTTSWEGYEFVENNKSLVKNILIPFYPYPPVDDLYREALRNVNNKSNVEGIINAKYNDEAAQKLIQGIGRGIRCPTDSCVIFTVDSRIAGSETNPSTNIKKIFPERFLRGAKKQNIRYYDNGKIHL